MRPSDAFHSVSIENNTSRSASLVFGRQQSLKREEVSLMNITELKARLEWFSISNVGESFSPIDAARFASKLFEINIPPQMIYNYIGKGYIKGYKNSEGSWAIDKDSFESWIAKYALKNLVTEI